VRAAIAGLSLLVLAVAGAPAQGEAAPADPLLEAQTLLGRLQAGAPASEFAAVARAIGTPIENARAAPTSDDDFVQLQRLLVEMRDRTRERIRALEAETGGDESALERLYRSTQWDDLSFALAAFPYWGAWVDLTIAERARADARRLPALHAAQLGFRAASVQFFHPGLVYGAWLGLGYIAAAQQRTGDALRLFERLDAALAEDPENPIRATVALEIRRLKGQATPSSASGTEDPHALTAPDAQRLRSEAFAILEDTRRGGAGPRPAAEKLKILFASAYVDDALIAEVLRYTEPIIGHDIGPFGRLVDAEDAFANEHWYDAARKYAQFFAAVGPQPKLDFSRFQYHHALAAYNAELFDEAIRLVEPLARARATPTEVRQAAAKLSYAAHAARYRAAATPANRRGLAEVIRRYLEASPADADADAARVLLAQVSEDAGAARSALGALGPLRGASAEARRLRFDLLRREFSAALGARDDRRAAALAREGIAQAASLEPQQRDEDDVVVTLVQMQSVLGDASGELLARIDVLDATPGMSQALRQALLWSRLRLLTRAGDHAGFLAYVERLAAGGSIEPWQLESVYVVLKTVGDPQRVVAASERLLPLSASAPAVERRLRLLSIESLLALNRVDEAYGAARGFVGKYPSSGNGWMLLARAAERSGEWIDADRAWRVITDRTPPGVESWWQGMVKRAEIRAASTRPESACDLRTELEPLRTQIPAALRTRFEAAFATGACTWSPGSG
jgi:hypothetical protein